jgi:methionine-gamma-lyase
MTAFNPEQAILNARRELGVHGGVTPSLSRSSTYTVADPRNMPEIFKGLRGPEIDGSFLYSRHANPTVALLSRYLAAMEGTEAAECTASGMAAIACTLLQVCRQGDHIVASDTTYGGTHALLAELLPQMGISSTFVDPTEVNAFENAITSTTKAIYVETFGNPTLKLADIPALSQIVRLSNVPLIVDNTFTPMVVSPAQLGADIVVYSMTKFIGGGSDLIAGAICADRAFIDRLKDLHTGRTMLLGPTMDARVAFDLIQRLPHLALRMREHGRRALTMAQRLRQLGVRVQYPGLPDYPQHQRARQLINDGYGFGGIVTVDCGTQARADVLMDLLQNKEKFGLIAVSLGYADTLMSCSSSSTSSEIPPEKQAEMALSPGLVRLSVGYTGDMKTRLGQLERAVHEAGIV